MQIKVWIKGVEKFPLYDVYLALVYLKGEDRDRN